ncbi:hypothetical protein OXB_0371 [Bacillus sp. OxB-1]|uniref:hypothetical protein n=1 Tax=Bacillus sp. (strain OxB-1) TaxID=98228 RepID=UPI00058207C4|nr:hypothetical protein [Bacillus sp. OxB-1]BAQ08843.1 hypothetical protein OXB_0371 [Bacillus sp. OxB-1]
MLWKEAHFKLESGDEVTGTIVSVGSNFLEVLVDDALPQESETTLSIPEEEHESEKREQPVGKTWIFSLDQIAHVEVVGEQPHRPCQ